MGLLDGGLLLPGGETPRMNETEWALRKAHIRPSSSEPQHTTTTALVQHCRCNITCAGGAAEALDSGVHGFGTSHVVGAAVIRGADAEP